MTEQEWVECTSPEPLLLFQKGKASDQKFRLVACACFRRIWHLLNVGMQNAIEAAERHFDLSDGRPPVSVTAAVRDAFAQAEPYSARYVAASIVAQMFNGAAWPLAWNAVSEARVAMRPTYPQQVIYEETRIQAMATRDILGNPFRPAFVTSAWLAWNEGIVAKLAQAIYEERAFDRLPVLADALEESGCTDKDILGHCRGAGPHVRGCWPVDLLLGKG